MSLFPQTTNTDMEAFKIHYGGQTNQIDANTYINSLLHFTNIVEETNKILSPDSKVQINIKAHEPGSFITDIVVMAQTTLEPVVNSPVVQTYGYVKTLIETVGGLYSLAKFLGSKNPKEVQSVDGSTRVTNIFGSTTIFNNVTYNIYNTSPTVRTAIAQEMETLANDPNVQSFDLLDSNEIPIVEIERNDFEDMANDEGIVITKDENTKIDNKAILSIVSLSFETNKKWEFYYYGHRIKASIHDDAFKEMIDKGERFAKGDKLEAELMIKREKDETVQEYVNKYYVVTKIVRHIPREDAPKLFQ